MAEKKLGQEKTAKLADCFIFLTMIMWSILTLLLFSSFVLKADFFWHALPDFSRFYAVGKLIASGDGAHLYDLDTQRRWLDIVTAPARVPVMNFVEHPPHFLLMYVPISVFPSAPALLGAMLLSAISAVAALWLMVRTEKKWPLWKISALVLIAFGSGPGIHALLQGQPSWLIVALFALLFSGLFDNSDLAAGIACATSTIKPQYTPFLLLPLLAQRRWKAILVAVITGLIYAAICISVVGWSTMINYVPMILHSDSSPAWAGHPYSTMTCVRGVLSLLLPEKLALYASCAAMLLALAILYMIWLKPGSKNRAAALTVFLVALFSLHTYPYDSLILFIAFLLMENDLAILCTTRRRALKVFFLVFNIVSAALFLSKLSPEIKTVANFSIELLGLIIICSCYRVNCLYKEPLSQPNFLQDL